MKKSDILKEELAREENDLKAMGAFKKYKRQFSLEYFEETILPKLKEKYSIVYNPNMERYTFEVKESGIIDFYPKANKLLIRKLNKWYFPGSKHLIKLTQLQLKN